MNLRGHYRCFTKAVVADEGLKSIDKQNSTLLKLFERGKDQAIRSGKELDTLSATSKI